MLQPRLLIARADVIACTIVASIAFASAQVVVERRHVLGASDAGDCSARVPYCEGVDDASTESEDILSVMQVSVVEGTSNSNSWLNARLTPGVAGSGSSLGIPIPASGNLEEEKPSVGRATFQASRERATKSKVEKPKTFGSLVPTSAETMHKPWIGVLIMFAGQTLVNVGDIFQKGSHDEVAKEKAEGRCKPGTEKPYFTRTRWLIGFGMWAVGALITWFAYWFAAESALACIQIWGAAVVIGLAPKLLGEHVSMGVLAGVFMVVLGIVACSLSAPGAEEMQTAHSLYLSWTNPAFFYVTFGFAGTIGVITSRWLFLPSRTTHWFEFIIAATILDVYSIICSKATAMLSMGSVTTHVNQVCTVSFWVHVFFTYFFRFASMHFMNMAFKVRPAVVVVPVLLSLNTIGEASAGGLFFGEFSHMTRVQEAWFSVGIVCTIAGVGIMFTVSPNSYSCIGGRGKVEEPEGDLLPDSNGIIRAIPSKPTGGQS